MTAHDHAHDDDPFKFPPPRQVRTVWAINHNDEIELLVENVGGWHWADGMLVCVGIDLTVTAIAVANFKQLEVRVGP